MVAYTEEFCIPFFECTDNPCTNLGDVCNPISVWCAAMQAVEAQLTFVDTVIARTATAVPQAKVSLEYESATLTLGQVPFDVTELDTDNMVDLSAFQGITPRRTGIYFIHAQVLMAPVITNDFPDICIYIGNEVAPTLGGALSLGPLRSTVRGFNTAQYVHVAGHWEFTETSPSPRAISLQANSANINILEANLSVSWHSDLD
jgi:hypothetical protein